MGKKNIASIEVNSKMKKKFKLTKKKLNFNKENLEAAIDFIQNPAKQTFNKFSPVYLYIVLKDPLPEDKIKKIKNKLVKVKHSLLSSKTKQKLCLIENELNEKEKIDLASKSKCLAILSNDELKNKIKKLKQNELDVNSLNYIYQIFVSNSKYNFSQLDNINKHCDVLYYEKKNIENLKQIIEKIDKGATIIKINQSNKKIFRIKCGNASMEKNQILTNITNMIYKASSFILAQAQKFNTVQSIIISSETSVPFKIYGELSLEDFNIFDN